MAQSPARGPASRARFVALARGVENSEGGLEEADAVEGLLVEEMRLLGREAVQGWAERRVAAAEQEIRQQPHMHRQGEKTRWHTKFGEIEVLEPQYRFETRRVRP